MPRLPNILQPKWKQFRSHHERLATAPDPESAQAEFDRRIHRSRRVGIIRVLFFVGLYFSFVTASLGFLLDWLQVPVAGNILRILQAVASSLSVVFLAGIFLCTRILNYLEIELYFYSAESRLPRPDA